MLDCCLMSRARSPLPRAGRALALWAACCASQGCSQALGLGGLTFEDTDAGDGIDAGVGGDSGATGAPDAGAGDAGVGLGPIEIDSSLGSTPPHYPALLAPGSLLAGSPDTASYIVYHPPSGSVVKHDVDISNGSYEAGESWDWQSDWSMVLQIPHDEAAVLIGYDVQTGIAEHVVIDPQGLSTSDSERIAGSPGWTHFASVKTSSVWHNLVYNSDTGLYRFGPALADDAADGDVVTGTWDTHWTALVTVPIDDQVGALKYDALTGDVEVEQLTGSATELGSTWTGELVAGRNLLVPFTTAGGVLLLTYSPEDGAVETQWLTFAEQLEVELEESKSWRIDLTQILPVWQGGVPHVVTYSADTGVAEVRDVLPLESTPVEIN